MSDPYGFDRLDLDWLQSKPGVKWSSVERGALAAWVADMDFPAPPPVVHALDRVLRGGDLGYPDWRHGTPLRSLFAERMAERFGWAADPGQVREFPDVIGALQHVLMLATRPGDGVALHTPCYPPFLTTLSRMERHVVPISARREPCGWAFDHEVADPARVSVLLVCNPHNPTGRVFRLDELEALADQALRHGWLIVSDEIHADLTYEPHHHVPIASLSPEVAARTVTLASASKAFNLAGVRCAVAHVGPPDVRTALDGQPDHLKGAVSLLGVEATRAAWQQGDGWLAAVRRHLAVARTHLVGRLARDLPAVDVVEPEATYLAWLDCRALGLVDEPAAVFGAHGVRLYEGPEFGDEGRGFARLNFATSRAVLDTVVERMAAAISDRRLAGTADAVRSPGSGASPERHGRSEVR